MQKKSIVFSKTNVLKLIEHIINELICLLSILKFNCICQAYKMKNKLIILLFLTLPPCFVFSQNALDSLLTRIDSLINESTLYSTKKEVRIKGMKDQLKRKKSDSEKQYELNYQLYKEYKSYISDSAIYYLRKNVEIATKLNDKERINQCQIQLAYLMGSLGMYKEGVDILETINRTKLSSHLICDYYAAYDHIYGELAFYTQDKESAKHYRQISTNYKDSLNNCLPIHDELRLILKETYFRDIGNYTEAGKLNDIQLLKAKKETPEYALTTFYRALLYRRQGKIEEEKYYLALSVLSDIAIANKDHASLFMLARILYNQGDIERAYNYIRFSWSETVFYNARLRSLQSASILSLIDKTYQAKIEKQKSRLKDYLILISILLLILSFIAYYLNRQMKRSKVLQKNIQEANIQLENINEELKQLNVQLLSTNIDLSEANKIKEEYIGRFIKLCSTYIDKLDSYRRMINKKISSGQTAEVLKITRSQDVLDKEFEELYANFDAAFLQLFPDFVNKVNDLFIEEDNIVLKRDEIFNTELRILALIRLGINDSQQIADFLRYSVNTIYNYRAKIKNRANVTRTDFESLIMLIR